MQKMLAAVCGCTPAPVRKNEGEIVMKKSTLIMILSLVLAVAIGVGSTLAYLQDTDADVNVMTLGSVYITQNEQERDADGKLVPFTPNKPAYPAVYEEIHWAPDGEGADVNGTEYLVFDDSMKNVIDKIVTVTNTGKSDAYVRTIVAIEAPDYDPNDLIHVNYNADIEYTAWTPVDIGGVKYVYSVFTYPEALAPQETSVPSLVQLFLDKKAKNEDIEKFGETWEVLVISQAVQTMGFEDSEDENATAANEALDAAFGKADATNVKTWFEGIDEDDIGSPGDKNDTNNPPKFYTGDPAELASLLSDASDAESGNVTIELTESYDMTGYDWTPVYVDGYHGADVVTVNGNGNRIKGLSAPLYSGGFAGGSGIVINDLTIIDADMTDEDNTYAATGYGAFICAIDSMDIIELNNCHLLDSKVFGSRTGGLVGWTSGYNVTSDGPVDSYINIKNCSVENCEISGNGTVGAINGHAGCNPATYTTIENCTVKNCTLISYDDSYRVGVVLGTANVGEVTIKNITEEGNTVKQMNGSTEIARPAGQSNLYGRFVPGSTGKLVIDGTEID